MGIDPLVLQSRWDVFEPDLESGRANAVPSLGPELTWVTQVADELGKSINCEILDQVEREWDFTRRAVLLDPPVETLEVLSSLRSDEVPEGHRLTFRPQGARLVG